MDDAVMGTPTSDTLQRIKKVARLRVEGATWDKVARRFGYKNAESARTMLTQEHPEEWKEAFEAARERYLNAVEAEAVLTQRELMRPTRKVYDEKGNETGDRAPRKDKVRQQAAHSLLNHTAKLRAQKVELSGDGTGGLFVGMSDEQLQAIIEGDPEGE